jgi:hypothetical protein
MRFTKISVLAVLAAGMFFASNASAAVVIGGADGWSFSTDGMVNLFAVYQTGDNLPDGVDAGYSLSPGDADEGFRITNGFLPNILAFNIKAPTMNGLDTGARIGFYPSSAHGNDKNRTDTQIDLREVFFTVDGNFGQIMVGKGLSLFLGQNLLTEQTLMGAGRMAGALNTSGLGVTLGRIGYGYLYPNFNAQVRYTTPDMGGAKFAIGLYDPSNIAGSGVDATETKLPRVEAELSYAGVAGDATIKTYVNAMWQEADFTSAAGVDEDDATAWGVSGGFVTGLAGFELSGSVFTGRALGTSLLLDSDSLDADGKERKTWGYIGQLSYTFANEGKTKVGLSYGANRMSETSADAAAADAFIKVQSMATLMVTQDITTNLKLVAEASYLNHEWHNDSHMEVEMLSIGTFFLW